MTLLIVFFFIILILSIIEELLFIFFNKWYYQHGIRIMHFSFHVIGEAMQIPTAEKINLCLLDSERIKFKLKEISKGKIAFRESIFQWKIVNILYRPIMRGYLNYDQSSRRIEIYGLLMWSVATMAFFLIVLFVVGNLIGNIYLVLIGIGLILIFSILNGLYFFVQSKRYKEFAHIVSKIKF
jgi:hypothetical protein